MTAASTVTLAEVRRATFERLDRIFETIKEKSP
jgi:hypothetical protein